MAKKIAKRAAKASPAKAPAKKAVRKAPPKSAANKTVATASSVSAFIEAVENETRRRDAKTLVTMMREISGEKPKLWGPSIIGFGSYHYAYDSGREGDMPLIAFSPRKANMVVYIMPGFEGYEALLKRLGKHKTGKSCLYLNDLDQIDAGVLRELAVRAYAHMKAKRG